MKGLSAETNSSIKATLMSLFEKSPRINAADLMNGRLNGRLVISMENLNGQRVIFRRISYESKIGKVRTDEVIWTECDGDRNITSRKYNSPANLVSYKFRMPSVKEAGDVCDLIVREMQKVKEPPKEAPVAEASTTVLTSNIATLTSGYSGYPQNVIASPMTEATGVQLLKRLIEMTNYMERCGDSHGSILCRIEAHLSRQVEISEEMLTLLKKF